MPERDHRSEPPGASSTRARSSTHPSSGSADRNPAARAAKSTDSGAASHDSGQQQWHFYAAPDLQVQHPVPPVQLPVRVSLRFVQVTSNDGGPADGDRKLIRSHAAAGHGLNESHEQRLSRLRKRRAASRAKQSQKQQKQDAQPADDGDDVHDEVKSKGSNTNDSALTPIKSPSPAYDPTSTISERIAQAYLKGKAWKLELSDDLPAALFNTHNLAPSPSNSSVDPFSSLPIKFSSPWMEMILRHFFARWILDVPELDGPGLPRAYTAKHWHKIQSHPAALSSHLLLSAGFLIEALKLKGDVEKVLQLKSETLRRLNECVISGDYSDEVLLAIVTLINYEDTCGTKEDLIAHMSGMKQLVALRGGLDGLRPYTKRMIVWQDKSMAMSANIARSFPQHSDEEVFQRHDITAPPSLLLQHGFQRLFDGGKLDQDLVDPLRQLQSIFEKLRNAYGSPLWNDSVSRHEWIVTESKLDVTTFINYLRQMARNYNRFRVNAHKVKVYDMDDMIRLGALALFYHLRQRCLRKLDRTSFQEDTVNSIVQHISPATLISNYDSWFSDEQGRVLWWVYSIATFASQSPSKRLRDLLLVLREKLRIRAERTSAGILSEFVYCDRVLGADHTRLWRWITAGSPNS